MIVITIEGGLVQGVSSDDPAELGKEVAVINYDIDEADPSDIHRIPQGDGEIEEATIGRHEVGVLFKPVAECLRANR